MKSAADASQGAVVSHAWLCVLRFRKAVVMRKKGSDGKELSMGYGFVEFKTAAHAASAMKKKQGVTVDGRALQLARSEKKLSPRKDGAAAGKKQAPGKVVTSKINMDNDSPRTAREMDNDSPRTAREMDDDSPRTGREMDDDSPRTVVLEPSEKSSQSTDASVEKV
eukprot:gene136-100_t